MFSPIRGTFIYYLIMYDFNTPKLQFLILYKEELIISALCLACSSQNQSLASSTNGAGMEGVVTEVVESLCIQNT